MLKISNEDKKELEKKHYGVYEHSAVQICEWNKKALRKEGVCYKEKFYNAHTSRCMQFTPLSLWCTNKCIFCWRPMEYMKFKSINKQGVLKPEEFVDKLIEKRKKLLSGFRGRKGMNIRMFEEALIPDHFAISLSGEPTLYPYLPELIRLLKNKYNARTVFIVTNGQEPQMIERLIEENNLPDQLYLSLSASNKESMQKINVPLYKDYWERMKESLELLKRIGNTKKEEIKDGYVINKKKTRTVLRFTLIKGLNDSEEDLKRFVKLFNIGKPWFIEIKAYMYIGLSKQRLNKENMPFHKDIKIIADKLNSMLEDYEYCDEQQQSRIVLLKRRDISEDMRFFKP